MLDNIEQSVKIIVVGNGNVGKTSMLRRYCKGQWTDKYKKTIGAEFMEKEVYVKSKNQSITLMLWDTAGQEIFNALTATYYRGAAAAILSFSTTDRDSFYNVEKWKQKVEAQCGQIPMVLCQTKIDLQGQSAISPQEVDALCAKFKMPFFRTSTKENQGLVPMFEFVAEQCLSMGSLDAGLTVLQGNAPPAAAKPKKEEVKKEKKEHVEEEYVEQQKPVNMREPVRTQPRQERSWCTML